MPCRSVENAKAQTKDVLCAPLTFWGSSVGLRIQFYQLSDVPRFSGPLFSIFLYGTSLNCLNYSTILASDV